LNWLALIPILLAFSARLVPGPRIVDDAYITFRYANNLAAGLGLVYNPGEWVLGTTTPLYTLFLTSSSFLLRMRDFVPLAWLLNALLDSIGTGFLFWIGRKLSGNKLVGLGVASLWAIAPFSVTFAIGGLETSLVITLLLAAFAFHLNNQDKWAALSLALGTLCRPDVLIAAVVIFGSTSLHWMLERARPSALGSGVPASDHFGRGLGRKLALFPYTPFIIFLALLIPWLIYASLAYGTPLPNSLAAKSVAYHLPPEAALVRLLQHLATPFHEHLLLGGRWIIVGLILYGSLFAIGGLSTIRRNPRAWPLFLYPVLYVAPSSHFTF